MDCLDPLFCEQLTGWCRSRPRVRPW